jgi:hypothetical protein
MGLLSVLSFILSKTSFLISALLAIKQYLTPHQNHERSEKNKLEVVHIPISKYGSKKHRGEDYYHSDESKLNNYFVATLSPANIVDSVSQDIYDQTFKAGSHHGDYEDSRVRDVNYFKFI